MTSCKKSGICVVRIFSSGIVDRHRKKSEGSPRKEKEVAGKQETRKLIDKRRWDKETKGYGDGSETKKNEIKKQTRKGKGRKINQKEKKETGRRTQDNKNKDVAARAC